MSRGRQIAELTRTRMILFWREPEAVFWVLVFPIGLVLVLALAFRRGNVEEADVGVLAGAGATELVQRLEGGEHLDVVLLADAAEAERQLRGGEIEVLAIPGDPPVLRLDPARPETELARWRVLDALRRGGDVEGAGPAEPARIEAVEETGSRYVDWVFAGLLGANLMSTAVWGIGFALVDQRRQKLIRRLLVTPMRRSSYLIGFVLSRLWTLVLEVTAISLFAFLVMDVPFRGSFVAFLLICVLGGMSFVGLGLLTASRAQTIEGISGLTNVVAMPMWLLSGVFFSYTKFPEFMHPAIRALPLTAMNDALRAVLIEGHDTAAVLPQLGVMLVWGAVAFVVTLKVFRWS